MIAYASRTGTRRNLDALRVRGWRLLVSAAGVLRTEGFRYALDNGAWSSFQRGEPFDERRFGVALRALGRDAEWCVMPDIVAGGHASLDLSLRWMRRVLDETEIGMLAVQDGIEPRDVAGIIGSRVGVFVGGSTAWKLDRMSEWAREGVARGAWVHIARVNTARRISRVVASGAHSFDGTSATRYAVNIPRLDRARRQLPLFGGS